MDTINEPKKLGRPKTKIDVCLCNKPLERDSKGRILRKYCDDCRPKQKGRPQTAIFEQKTCQGCGKTFKWRFRKDNRGSMYCSIPCANKSIVPPAKYEIHICLNCGKEFEWHVRKNRRGEYCSKECVSASPKVRDKISLKKIQSWQQGKYKGVHFWNEESLPSSKLELSLIPVFEKLGYRHTGKGGYWVHGKDGRIRVPDFKKTGSKEVFEIWGNYWHRDHDDIELIKWYEDAGFVAHVLWESDVEFFLEDLSAVYIKEI